MTSVLVTGAGGSAAANFVDALRRAPHQYHVVGTDRSALHLHLSLADVRLVLPGPDEPGFEAALVEALRRHRVDVVHAQPDSEVVAIGAARDRLPARTLLPPQKALDTAADKQALADALVAHGVPVPQSVGVPTVADIGDLAAPLLAEHGRLWVRARQGAGARASLPVRSVEQAAAWVRWWVDERGMDAADFMLCEYLPGREFAYQSLWQDGELVVGQARERVEYLYGHLTPSGQTSTPAVARTVRLPAVDETAAAAIRAIDGQPHGVYCVDLKEDASAQPKVTEVNAGRFFTTSNFFAAAGLNMPDLFVRCALGEKPPRLGSSPLEPGLYWIRMVDMGYALVPSDELDPWPRPDP